MLKLVKNKKFFAFLIITLFFIIKLFMLFKTRLVGYRLVGWDESVYLGMGKYIYSFGKVGLWEPLRPVVVPLLVGLLWFLKLPYIFFSSLLMLIISCLTLLLIYKISVKIFNEKIGLIAMVFTVLTFAFFDNSILIMTHIPSLFFTLLGIYFFIENKAFISGILISIGFLTRFPQGIALVGLIFYIFIKERKIKDKFLKSLKVCLGFSIPLIIFLIFNYILYSASYGLKSIIVPFIKASYHQGHFPMKSIKGFFFYLIFIARQSPLLFLFFPSVFFIKRKRIETLFFIIGILIFLYYTIIPNKQIRYGIEFIPYFSILTGFTIFQLMKKISKKYHFKVKDSFIFGIVIVVGLISMITSSNTTLLDYSKGPIDLFKSINIKGNIYTMVPRPVAYIDAKFIPVYDLLPEEIIERLDEIRDASDYFIFFNRYYLCENTLCAENIEKIRKYFESGNATIVGKYEKIDKYIIFKIKNED